MASYLSQEIFPSLIEGRTYRLSFDIETNGLTRVFIVGDNFPYDESFAEETAHVETTFTYPGGEGGSFFVVEGNFGTDLATIDNVSIRSISGENSPVDDTLPVKEFLVGQTDAGQEIVFRADTQQIQLFDNFEIVSNPTQLVTRVQRGERLKCFVSLDGGQFYELQGTAFKGVTIIKIHSEDRKHRTTPSTASKIQISWRDSSKQLCRLIQTAIIFIPGTIGHTE